MSTHCDFKDKLGDYMRDRLVSGIRNDAIKKRLLGEADLTYEKAVQIATTMETADQDAATFHRDHQNGASRVNNISRGGKRPQTHLNFKPKREESRVSHQNQQAYNVIAVEKLDM